MIVTAADFLPQVARDAGGVVRALVSRVLAVANNINGPTLKVKLAGLRITFQWSGPGAGTGAYFDANTTMIVVDCGVPPPGNPPLNTYTQIPAAVLPEIWDQFAFEFRNFYNAPQIERAKRVGMYGGALQSYGDAMADVECISWTLYVGDLQAVVAGASPGARAAMVGSFSLLGRRALARFVQQVIAGAATAVPLMNLFQNSPHGGPGAVPGSRQALLTPVMYTVQRIEGWNDDVVSKVIATRMRDAMTVPDVAKPPLNTLIGAVDNLRVAHAPLPGADAVARFNALVGFARTDWTANAGLYTAFLVTVAALPALAPSLANVDAALVTVMPNVATIAGGATVNQPLNPVPAPVITPADITTFVQSDPPNETALTTELRNRDGGGFLTKAR